MIIKSQTNVGLYSRDLSRKVSKFEEAFSLPA